MTWTGGFGNLPIHMIKMKTFKEFILEIGPAAIAKIKRNKELNIVSDNEPTHITNQMIRKNGITIEKGTFVRPNSGKVKRFQVTIHSGPHKGLIRIIEPSSIDPIKQS